MPGVMLKKFYKVMRKVLYYLFKKSPMRRQWIFIIACIPFVLFGLIGAQYGAFFLYMIPGGLCIIQFFYPTIFLWGLFFIIFLSSSATYLFILLTDIFKLFNGLRPSALLDIDDSVVFILLLLILIGITFVLFFSRPRLTSIKKTT